MRTRILFCVFAALWMMLGGGCGGGSGDGGGAGPTTPAPTLSGVGPALGPMMGGTPITLTGTGFSYAPVTVRIGGIVVPGPLVTGDTQITCSTPANTARGPRDVEVTTAGGTVTRPNAFTYQDVFAGTYHYAGFTGDSSVPNGTAEWGHYIGDGLGSVAGGTVNWSTNGTPGTASVLPGPYRITSDRDLIWSTSVGVDTLSGGISAYGDLAVLGSIRNGDNPYLGIYCRREGSFSNASLNGDYHMMMLYWAGATDASMWGTATFDGSGGVSYVASLNQNGTVSSGHASAGTYNVLGNGAFEWIEASGQVNPGGILLGNDLVICGGGTAPGTVPTLTVFIRKSTTASTATMNGMYHYVNFIGHAGAGHQWSSSTGRAMADGSTGTMTEEAGELNLDGTMVPFLGGHTYAYTIAASGALKVGGGVSGGLGGISPAGDFACWAGSTSTTSTEAPQIWFWVR